jgi:hypothetical protein
MSKIKGNALDAFVRSAPTPPTIPPPTGASISTPGPVPGRRPASVGQQMIPYRVSQDAHRALKVLAAHDGTTLQAMIDAAVRTYAAQRGVKIP